MLGSREADAITLGDYPPVLSVEQVCEILHIHRKTCYKMIRDGTIPAVKLGHLYRVSKENVISYLNRGSV